MTATVDTTPMTKASARRLTDRIAKAVTLAYDMLAAAKARRAWEPLGYPSWEAYVRAEFGVSSSASYRLLDQAAVIGELSLAAGAPVEVSARAAADLKPDLPVVAAEVAEAVAAEPQRPPAEVAGDVVAKHRARRPPAPVVVPPADVEVIDGEREVAPARAVPDAVAAQPAAVLLVALAGRRPAEARDATPYEWAMLRSWMAQADAVRNGVPQPQARQPQEPAGEPAEKCRHPVSRRIGNRCGACGDQVKAGR